MLIIIITIKQNIMVNVLFYVKINLFCFSVEIYIYIYCILKKNESVFCIWTNIIIIIIVIKCNYISIIKN